MHRPFAKIYMIIHGSGMQQHSMPSQSRHLVWPDWAGLVMEPMLEPDEAEEGRMKLTGAAWVVVHIVRVVVVIARFAIRGSGVGVCGIVWWMVV